MAATVRQLRLVVEAKGMIEAWGDALSPPRVIHYGGHIIARPGAPGRFPADEEPMVKAAIDKLLAEEDDGFGYGSLAAGADILLFAEALLARGAGLHLVLPFDPAEFVEVSVRPSGAAWVERFEKCYGAAVAHGAVHFATEDRYLGDDHLFAYCSQLAMGLALLRARHLSASVEQIVVWDGGPAAGPARHLPRTWRSGRARGLPRKEITVGNGFQPGGGSSAAPRGIERRPRAMLFGDMHGFSGLRDDQLPRFIEKVLGCFARVIDQHKTDILLANTWGDGLFLVFDDAGKAAGCAIDLQEAVGRLDFATEGLPADMGLRIGLHLGPAYSARDPVLGKENFFGVHVSRAARIEPVTPEGSVYVTETMAAVLALYNSREFACEYVGSTEAAKNYGALRMFLLRRQAAAPQE